MLTEFHFIEAKRRAVQRPVDPARRALGEHPVLATCRRRVERRRVISIVDRREQKNHGQRRDTLGLPHCPLGRPFTVFFFWKLNQETSGNFEFI